MKRKFLFALAATVLSIAMCLLAACAPQDPNKGPSGDLGDDGKEDYVAMTWDDFEVESQKFAKIENYTNVQGLKLDLALTMAPTSSDGTVPTAENPETKSVKYDLGAIVDLSDLQSLSASVNFKAEGQDDGLSALNAYLYSGKLYVDLTSGGQTQKDSIDGLDFGIADLMGLIGDGVPSPDMGLIPDLGMEMPSEEEISAYLDFFKGKTAITYSKKQGNYILKVTLDEKETVNKTEIPAFELTLSLTVKNDRVTSLEADFGMKDGSLSLEASLVEYKGEISTPTNPESYNGDLLDEFESVIKAMFVKKSDFYGTWTGIAGDGSSVSLTVSEQGATLTIVNDAGDGPQTETTQMTSVEYVNMTLTMKAGEMTYTAMLIPSSNMLALSIPEPTGEPFTVLLGKVAQ